ncbi:MAG: NADH-quinone oxidoreductase subunit B family protein [Planctomycetota bacterium]|jgi:hydrogenase small subunit
MQPINLIWLQGQGCTGDTVSLISARDPSLVDVLTGILPEVSDIKLAYHPTVMAPWGETALGVLDEAKEGKLDPFVLVLEGAIPDEGKAAGEGGFYCAVGNKGGELVTIGELLTDLKGKAAAAVAVGSCAAFGGIAGAKPNPTGARGLIDFFGKDYRSTLGLPVINVSGCPAPGDNCIKTLACLALVARGVLASPPELDEHNRPLFLYGELAHHVCPRAGYLAHGDFSRDFGEPYCMGLLGCKGPIAHCTVPRDGFSGGVGGCPTVGSICIGCTEPGFPDKPFSPFFKKASAWTWTVGAMADTIGHVRAALTRLIRRRI